MTAAFHIASASGSLARCWTAGRVLQIGPSAAIKLKHRVRQSGSTAPANNGGSRRHVLERTLMCCAGWCQRGRHLPYPAKVRVASKRTALP